MTLSAALAERTGSNTIKTGKNTGRHLSVASVYRALASTDATATPVAGHRSDGEQLPALRIAGSCTEADSAPNYRRRRRGSHAAPPNTRRIRQRCARR